MNAPQKPFNLGSQDKRAWQERSVRAARLWAASLNEQSPPQPVVADLGCGDRKLESALREAAGRSVDYRGYDILPQSAGTAAMDLEKQFPAGPFDAVFCLGVLEYASDLPRWTGGIAGLAPLAVISYTVSDSNAYSPEAVAKKGWRSHHSSAEMEKIFKKCFDVLRTETIDAGKTRLWLLRPRAGVR